MNSEQREIRPFRSVSRIQGATSGWTLVVGDSTVESGASIDLNRVDFQTAHVDLEIAADDEGVAHLAEDLRRHTAHIGLPPESVDVVVFASTPRLKLVQRLYRVGLDQLDGAPEKIMLAGPTHRPAPFEGRFGGVVIDAYVLLAHQLEPAPLRPWRKGTWLAHHRFELKTTHGEIGFLPLELDDELRDLYQLPRSTQRFVTLEGSALEPDVDDGNLRVYVDSRLLSLIAQHPNTPGSRFFQRQLFLDASRAIVSRALRDEDLSEVTAADLEGSMLGRLIDMAAATDVTAQALLDEVRDDPDHFLARLDGAVDLFDDLEDAVMGNQ